MTWLLALVNLEQLWLLTHNQISQHSSADGEGTYDVPPLAKGLLAPDGYWGEGVLFFFSGVGTGRLPALCCMSLCDYI